jgi:hypothetical protein
MIITISRPNFQCKKEVVHFYDLIIVCTVIKSKQRYKSTDKIFWKLNH